MKNGKRIRVLIVDDHKVVRVGLRTVLGEESGMEVAGEAASVASAVAEAKRLQPDIILLDVRLPDGTGLDVCRQIKATHPEIRILVLTSFADNALVLDAIEAGADGYLLKEIDSDEILRGIENVVAGGAILDPAVTRQFLSQVREDKRRATGLPAGDLSGREQQLLALVAAGRTNREIATELRLSEGTVRNYLSNVFNKLGVSRRAQAVAVYKPLSPGA
jgi:DNA-binding NarL/FixJ family response regulator